MRYIAGIDYSMTSPALCLFSGAEWAFENCRFFALSSKKKILENQSINSQIHIKKYPEWDHPIQRYSLLADYMINSILNNSVGMIPEVSIEGYSYSSNGSLIFNIAESGGVLKNRLYELSILSENPAPTTIKKFATGKGNASKQMMFESFLEETGVNFIQLFDINKLCSPFDDIIDSYYIAKYTFFKGEKNAKK